MNEKNKKGKKNDKDEDGPPPVVDFIHKKDIKSLTKGAEDTSSESDCCEYDSEDMMERRRRRTGLTSTMERSMKRLI